VNQCHGVLQRAAGCGNANGSYNDKASKGNFVRDLTKDDFQILDDGKPQELQRLLSVLPRDPLAAKIRDRLPTARR
jgi:hypothetical protein